MPVEQLKYPFALDDVEEIHLENAPLVRVLAQVRWQSLARMQYGFSDVARDFGLALAEEYPYSEQQPEMQILLTNTGVQQQSTGTVFQFISESGSWKVSLGSTFVTLETSQYTSRTDFLSKLKFVLLTLQRFAKIPRIQRLGFRYVNRIDDITDYSMLNDLLNPAVKGGAEIAEDQNVRIEHSLSETVYVTPTTSLLARWARLPANATIDPSIPGVPTPSWILDLDSYSEKILIFETGGLIKAIDELSKFGYRFFRWAVTEEFITKFGGQA